MFQVKFPRTLLLGVIIIQHAFCTLGQSDGIFAEFNTTLGSFTCRVEYAKAPKASASFIGLATGDRAWLDLSTGLVRTDPFYDGITFHRVIAGFVNQGGSPNGQGTDGPGYSFVDEFDPSLRHDAFGVLSMANSGPDSNGSQFFVTTAPTPGLDDVHTVFGTVVGGSNVVYTINNVATDTNDKPLTNVVIQSLEIRRVGAEALDFDIDAQGLPDVVPLETGISQAGTNVHLSFTNQLHADNRLYSGTNLTDWSESKLGIEVSLPLSNAVVRPMSGDTEFFRMAQVAYPEALYVPDDVRGKTLTLNFDGGNGTVVASFDGVGTGSYTWTLGSPGSILGYNWIQDPYRGRFRPIGFTPLPFMDLHLDYDSATVGTFAGTAYPNYPSSSGSFPLTGNFTSTP
jgi:cyclophilin family peptidyl-prolyl cis-trans isomerase